MKGSINLGRILASFLLVISLITCSHAKSYRDKRKMDFMARDLERKGDLVAAEGFYRQILASTETGDDPFRFNERERAYLDLARTLIKQKKTAEAKKIMQTSFEEITRETGPSSLALVKQHYSYGIILRSSGLIAEGLAERKIGNSIYELDNHRRNQQIEISKDREKGLKAILAGNKKLALSSLQTALAKAEKAGEWNSELPASLLDLGCAELEYGNKTKSVSLLKRALDLRVKHGEHVYGEEYSCTEHSSSGAGTTYTQTEPVFRKFYASALRATGKAKDASVAEKLAQQKIAEIESRRLGIRIMDKDGKPIKGVKIKSASGAMDGISGSDGELISTKFDFPAMTIQELAHSELGYMNQWRESLARTVRGPTNENQGVVTGWDVSAEPVESANKEQPTRKNNAPKQRPVQN